VSVNVGLMRGGSAVNVVPERAEVRIEVRSLVHASGARVVDRLRRALEETAREAACTIEVDIENAYRAYRHPPGSAAVRLASAAFAAAGCDAAPIETRGGSDANVFCARGLDCVNLAHAVVDFHGPDERVAVADLVLMERVLLEIVAAARSAGPAS